LVNLAKKGEKRGNMRAQFGEYTLDTKSLELSSNGKLVEIEPQVFSLLVCLVENRDRVVSKDELIEMVWNGRIVSDSSLNTRINTLRKAVGDDGKTQAVIKTFPRRGFRFVAVVNGSNAVDSSVANTTQTTSDKPSIAVLPFKNFSGDPGQVFFSDGITEDTITALSRCRWLSVIGGSTAFSFKDTAVDVQTIASELNVRYVLEGSVQTSGDRVRISAQLVEGETGRHIWAERFDRNLEDIFALQDEITDTVAGTVQSELGLNEQQRIKSKPPESLDAWEAYQRGLAILNERTTDSYVAAREQFERAIELDPNFVLPYTGYVDSVLNALAALEGEAYWNTAQRYARKSVELDPNESRAHASLGKWLDFNGDITSSIAEYETALELNPSDAGIHMEAGTKKLDLDLYEEAITHFNRAIKQSPRDVQIGRIYNRMALAHLALKDNEGTIEWGRKAIQYPNAPWAHVLLVAALANHGQIEEAKNMLAEAMDRRPELTISLVAASRIIRSQILGEDIVKGLRIAGMPEE
jgi:TolB-like protein/Tfp pilus assembly protein PilF